MPKYTLSHTGEQVDNLLTKIENNKDTRNFNLRISLDAWTDNLTNSQYPYQAQVSCSEIKASDHIIAGLTITATEDEIQQCSKSNVKCSTIDDKVITFIAAKKPAIALPISIVILG